MLIRVSLDLARASPFTRATGRIDSWHCYPVIIHSVARCVVPEVAHIKCLYRAGYDGYTMLSCPAYPSTLSV
jgi:hypothetical protein